MRFRIPFIACSAVLLAGAVLTTASAAKPEWIKGELRKSLGEVRIGITVLHPSSNSYQAQYAETAVAYSKEIGIDATVSDPQGDPSKQFAQIQNFISQRMDAIVVWPTNAKAVVPAIRKAESAGIPVIISNSRIEKDARQYTVAWTGPDDCGQARKAGEQLVKALDGEGRIVMVLGTPGYATAMIRERCFVEVIEEHPGIEVLAKQPANWNREKAQSVMENFLTKFGDSIDGVYAQDDGMGLGVLNAIRAAGYEKGDIKMTTANMFGEGYDAIKAGWHTGSVSQSPIEDAKLAIETAVRVVQGEEVPRVQYIPTPKVNASNLDEFDRPTW